MKKKIGIFGGTFDPIHFGHLLVAQMTLERYQLDNVIFIPAGVSPLKLCQPPVARSEDRLIMVKLSIHDNAHFLVDNQDLNRVSYTINTVHDIRKKYPSDDLFLILGSDCLSTFHLWEGVEEIKKMTKVVFCQRFSYPMSDSHEYEFINKIIDISSTEIRERCKNSLPIQWMLPINVVNFIIKNRIYTPMLLS